MNTDAELLKRALRGGGKRWPAWRAVVAQSEVVGVRERSRRISGVTGTRFNGQNGP